MVKITTLSEEKKQSLCAHFDVNSGEDSLSDTRTMDGIILILFSWFFVAILCYFFILAYNRRRRAASLHAFPSIRIGEEGNKKFLTDLANWLLWGLDENAFNDQSFALTFARFATKCLNEASRRLHKEGQLEVHFDAVQLREKSTISAFSNFQIHPNRTPGSHLSITGQFSNTRANNGPICLRTSVVDPEEERQFKAQMDYRHDGQRATPILKAPSIRQYSFLVHELIGQMEIRLASIAGELFIISCFKERPTVHLEVQESIGDRERAFLEEFVKRCILGAVLNFSIGELLYPDGETSARASRARLSAEYRNLSFLQEVYPPNVRISQAESRPRMSPKFPVENGEMHSPADLMDANYLRIELMEATQLEDLHSTTERPFVCIELDEPSGERFLSPRAHLDHENGHRVFWHEEEANFDLAVSSASGELLFEVFIEEEENSFSTVRERRFLGMAILGLAELRQILARDRNAELVRLQLQGRPEFRRDRSRPHEGEKFRGVLALKCSFHHRPQYMERPSAPLPDGQNSFAVAEYAQMKRRRTPPNEEALNKKFSTITNTSSSRRLPRQKHYIYNVNEDRLPYEQNSRGYDSETSAEKRSPSKISFDTTNLTPIRREFDDPAYSTIDSLNVNPVRKTISDTNALFQFGMENAERKRSAPETPVQSAKRHQNGFLSKSSQKVIEEHKACEEEEIHIHRPNEPFEHLFNGKKESREGEHPAMDIFKVPEAMKKSADGEIERKARERDRSARGRKQRRNFFEQIRDRLSGPVSLLPGKLGKRAKSLDDYEHHLEEVVSMPQSRDQSQTRYGEQKGSDHIETGQQLFIKSSGPSSASSMQFLHSPQTSQRTFSYHQNQLLLELVGPDEEGPRYYSIPMEISTEPAVVKLMQSGKKLHVHNAHILVASKSRGRVICSICNKRIGGNFSNRQAYQCRDCRIVCHKNCHRHIDWACENSSLFNLHVEEVDWQEFLRHHQLREFISVGNL